MNVAGRILFCALLAIGACDERVAPSPADGQPTKRAAAMPLPDDLPPDFPVYAHATLLSAVKLDDGYMLMFETVQPPDIVSDYFIGELGRLAWIRKSESNVGDNRIYEYVKGAQSLSFTVIPRGKDTRLHFSLRPEARPPSR